MTSNHPCIYYNIIGDTVYIGTTKHFETRQKQHRNNLKAGSHRSPHLSKANKIMQAEYNTHGSCCIQSGILQPTPVNEQVRLQLEELYRRDIGQCYPLANIKPSQTNIDMDLIKPYIKNPFDIFMRNYFSKTYNLNNKNFSFLMPLDFLHEQFIFSFATQLNNVISIKEWLEIIANENLSVCSPLLDLYLKLPKYFIFKFIKNYPHAIYISSGEGWNCPPLKTDGPMLFKLLTQRNITHSSYLNGYLDTLITDFSHIYLDNFPLPMDVDKVINFINDYNDTLTSDMSKLQSDISTTCKNIKELNNHILDNYDVVDDNARHLWRNTQTILSQTYSQQNQKYYDLRRKRIPLYISTEHLSYVDEQHINTHLPSPSWSTSSALPLIDLLNFNQKFNFDNIFYQRFKD